MTPKQMVRGDKLILEYEKENQGRRRMPKVRLKDQRPDYEIDNDAISDRMREAVEECEDYGTTEIAQFCKVNRTLVYEWMRVGGSRPSIENMTKFCKAVGVDFEWIMFGVSDYQTFEPMQTADVVELNGFTANRRAYRTKVKGDSSQGDLITIFIPAVDFTELNDNLNKNDKFVEEILEEWNADESSRRGLSIMVYEEQLGTHGIPTFCSQVISRDYEPAFTQGTVLGFATDLVPQRGDFVMMVCKKTEWKHWRYHTGFFFPKDSRLAANNMAQHFYDNYECVVAINPTERNHDDLYLDYSKGDRYNLIAVATYQTSWLVTMLKEKFTSLPTRREDAWKNRARNFELENSRWPDTHPHPENSEPRDQGDER